MIQSRLFILRDNKCVSLSLVNVHFWSFLSEGVSDWASCTLFMRESLNIIFESQMHIHFDATWISCLSTKAALRTTAGVCGLSEGAGGGRGQVFSLGWQQSVN